MDEPLLVFWQELNAAKVSPKPLTPDADHRHRREIERVWDLVGLCAHVSLQRGELHELPLANGGFYVRIRRRRALYSIHKQIGAIRHGEVFENEESSIRRLEHSS